MQRLPGGPTSSADRGVSDIIGYVMTFSVLIASVGVVTSVGFEQLEEMRTNEQLSNAERAFRLMERNLDQIQQSQAPVRASEIDLHAGSITTNTTGADAVVTIQRRSEPTNPVTRTIDLNDIRYEVNDRVVAYESGSVFYSDEHSNDVLEDGPEMICTDDTAVLSFVTLQSETEGQYLTGGTVGITARLNDTDLIYPMNRTGPDSVGDSESVRVEFQSRYDEAWNVFFDRLAEGWTQISGPPNPTFECVGDGDDTMQVYVRRTVINVSVQR